MCLFYSEFTFGNMAEMQKQNKQLKLPDVNKITIKRFSLQLNKNYLLYFYFYCKQLKLFKSYGVKYITNIFQILSIHIFKVIVVFL